MLIFGLEISPVLYITLNFLFFMGCKKIIEKLSLFSCLKYFLLEFKPQIFQCNHMFNLQLHDFSQICSQNPNIGPGISNCALCKGQYSETLNRAVRSRYSNIVVRITALEKYYSYRFLIVNYLLEDSQLAISFWASSTKPYSAARPWHHQIYGYSPVFSVYAYFESLKSVPKYCT